MKTILLKVDDELHSRLKEMADTNYRSLSAEAGFRLERAVERWERQLMDNDYYGHVIVNGVSPEDDGPSELACMKARTERKGTA